MPPPDPKLTHPPLFNPSAPPAFRAAELEQRLATSSSVTAPGTTKKKRPPIRHLAADCALYELPQYMCDVVTRRGEGGGERVEKLVECREVLRLFRRYVCGGCVSFHPDGGGLWGWD